MAHRHHSSRPPPTDRDRERMAPLHMTPSQPHSLLVAGVGVGGGGGGGGGGGPPPPPPPVGVGVPGHPQVPSVPHGNGHPLQSMAHGSSHPSPAMSNGHPPHPSQLGGGQLISPSQSAHAGATPVIGHMNGFSSAVQNLSRANEEVWVLIGEVAEQMGKLEFAQTAYEHALRHNQRCVPALSQLAGIARIKENYSKAINYFQRVVDIPGHETDGEVWSALGHCFLMQDDLQKAYAAYQQALYHLPNPKEDPKLWYGIGILYDRYGSLDHAEEAFASVLRMDKDFDKANEILFRLGIIYKQQGKYDQSLECFDRILRSPPSPLANVDIWFQIGHVYEQQKDYVRAKEAYERVVAENPAHAKVLQQLGWLFHQQGAPFQNQELAIQYLTKSLEADPSDAQSWYLLGRAYMAGQKYNKAYEAYQQAVYRDGRNPTFWCSIGVLYFQINQYRDALDAYSRAIRINPYISEVWFDLGSLYESCNNQISDAIDAYGRAAELDPYNPHIKQRLELLKNVQENGGQLPSAPGPQDVHPTAYATSGGAGPSGIPGGAGSQHLMAGGHSGPRLMFRSDSRGSNERGPVVAPIPPPPPRSPGPFRTGPPPPVVLDNRKPQLTQLAPMDLDRQQPDRAGRDQLPSNSLRGPSLIFSGGPPLPTSGHPSRSQLPDYLPPRRESQSMSPPNGRGHSPPYGLPNFSQQQQQHQRAFPNASADSPSQPSPRDVLLDGAVGAGPAEVHDRRDPHRGGDRGKERERRERDHVSRDSYSVGGPSTGHRYPFDGPRDHPSDPASRIPPIGDRSHSSPPRPFGHGDSMAASPPRPLDHVYSRRDSGNTLPAIENRDTTSYGELSSSRRYDPIYHGRERAPSMSSSNHMDVDRPAERKIELPASQENFNRSGAKPPSSGQNYRQTSESPHGDQRRRGRGQKERERERERERETESVDGRRDRRRKNGTSSRRGKDDIIEAAMDRSSPYAEQSTPASSRSGIVSKQESPDDKSVGLGEHVTSKPSSPPPSNQRSSARPVDEDYDEGLAETLIGLSGQRGEDGAHETTKREDGRSPPPAPSSSASSLKRPLSPVNRDETKDNKRSRTDSTSARATTPSGPSRPSPIPFRVQASPEVFRSAEMDKELSVATPTSSRVSKTPPERDTPRRGSDSSNHALPPSVVTSPRHEAAANGSDDTPIVETNGSERKPSTSPVGTPPSSAHSKRSSVPATESNVGESNKSNPDSP